MTEQPHSSAPLTPVNGPPSTTPVNTPSPNSPSAPDAESGLIDIADFAKVKLRVAIIEQAEKIEKSKKLYKLQIDLGPAGKRQVVSGIAAFYTPEQLLGRRVVVVTNLKPAKLMGVDSQGMLLAASNADHSALTLLAPSEEIAVGSEIA